MFKVLQQWFRWTSLECILNGALKNGSRTKWHKMQFWCAKIQIYSKIIELWYMGVFWCAEHESGV